MQTVAVAIARLLLGRVERRSGRGRPHDVLEFTHEAPCLLAARKDDESQARTDHQTVSGPTIGDEEGGCRRTFTLCWWTGSVLWCVGFTFDRSCCLVFFFCFFFFAP